MSVTGNGDSTVPLVPSISSCLSHEHKKCNLHSELTKFDIPNGVVVVRIVFELQRCLSLVLPACHSLPIPLSMCSCHIVLVLLVQRSL